MSNPRVRVVYEKSKNPDPLECIPGGLTKIDTNNKTHHKNVMMAKKTVKYLENRTLAKLYGETYSNRQHIVNVRCVSYTYCWIIRT
jgi:hypothetical protein